MIGDILFYHNKDFFSWLIQVRTKGRYNHVCVEVERGLVVEAVWPKVRVEERGTPAYVYTPPISDGEKLLGAIDWLYTTVGSKYDFLDIIANVFQFILPRTKLFRTPSAFICSELTAYYLLKAGYQFPADFQTDERSLSLVTPNSLARILQVPT